MGCWHWCFHRVHSNRSRKYGSLFRGTGFCTQYFPLYSFCCRCFFSSRFVFSATTSKRANNIHPLAAPCTPKLSEQDDIIVKYTHAFPSDRDTIYHPNIQHPRICNTAGYIDESKEEEVAQSETEICTKWKHRHTAHRQAVSQTETEAEKKAHLYVSCIIIGKPTTMIVFCWWSESPGGKSLLCPDHKSSIFSFWYAFIFQFLPFRCYSKITVGLLEMHLLMRCTTSRNCGMRDGKYCIRISLLSCQNYGQCGDFIENIPSSWSIAKLKFRIITKTFFIIDFVF